MTAATHNRPGRPSTPAAARRSMTVKVLLTPTEKQQLLEVSRALDMPLGEFIRSAALRSAAEPAARATDPKAADNGPVCAP